MKIKGAIFDMDGTLLDSMFVWETAGIRYLRTLGIEPRPDLNDNFINKSLFQAAEYLRTAYQLPLPAPEIMDGINKGIEDLYFTCVEARPGVAEYLQEMDEAGIPMCIASATDEYLVRGALKRTELLRYFKKIFTCTDVGAGKDEPLIFMMASEFLGTRPAETAVFEDALYAARTAKGAGFILAAVCDHSEKRQEELRSMADFYIEDFRKAAKLWK